MTDQALQIVYQDDALLVVNKPPGLHSVELPSGKGGASLASLLVQRFPEIRSAALKQEDCGLVNRLDHETSGLLLVARSRTVWDLLRKALLAGQIEKHYLALVEGIAPPHYEVEAAIGAKGRRSKKVSVISESKSNSLRWELSAKTNFNTLKHFPELDISLVRATAHTARRHQIRAHSAHAGHALLGDALYGSSRTLASIKERFDPKSPVSGFFLHAEMLQLKHPLSAETLELSCQAWLSLC